MTSSSDDLTNGFSIVQKTGGFVEMYFDWDRLPTIDLSRHYYLVELIPESQLPKEYARPNSGGPLHFSLVESVTYQVNLLRVAHLSYQVEEQSNPELTATLVPQHENLQKLIWGNLKHDKTGSNGKSKPPRVISSGQVQSLEAFDTTGACEIVGRPGLIRVLAGNGDLLFRIKTNYDDQSIIASRTLPLKKTNLRLSLSTVIDPGEHWKVRAEFSTAFRIRLRWKQLFLETFKNTDPAHLIGLYRFSEDKKTVAEIRQFGFSTRIGKEIIDRIQTREWQLKEPKQVRGYKLQLQITSAHRELFRFVLKEKEYPAAIDSAVIGFTESEIDQAELDLHHANRHVSWDQAHLELVLFFKTEENRWHEFQRDTAHNLRWDFLPGKSCESCQCEWVLQDIQNLSNRLVAFTSDVERRIHWPDKLVMKPFSANQLLVWWDVNQGETETRISDEWQVTPREVGYYLKIHEEYLGSRIHRVDLDVQILRLFSTCQNLHIIVDPDKCYSAEIVARYQEREMALTPVSKPIITPRLVSHKVDAQPYHKLNCRWFHNSQREVGHQQGRERNNQAKVQIHLHFHSPNLFRIDPFRDRYLRDSTWPVQTMSGAEVHNPPGEWVTRNCMDSWLPLLRVFKRLAAEGVDYQISLNISPPVAYMVSSPRFKDYMSRYLMRVQRWVQSQVAIISSTKNDPQYIWAAERYLEDIKAIDFFYNHEIDKDMIGAFRELEAKGFLEISTCTATHGMPGELESMPDSLHAQIVLAARSHHRFFGNRPHGIWLAENSCFPGVEKFLEREHLNYFFVESESILKGSFQPWEEEFNPVMIKGSNVVAFPRSRVGRTQVWDAEIGYAGHPDFREYHFRHFGLPIKKITTKTSTDKQPYHPDNAEQTAKELARDFHHKLCEQSSGLNRSRFKTIPLITCSYDAELFGHHWSEGPLFLEELLRQFYYTGDTLGLSTPSHYLIDSAELPELTPNPSTWGHEATHVRWSDARVAWIYKELERAEGVLNRYLGFALEGKLNELEKQMVEQMAKELIRAQSSDLPFVIISGDFEEDMQREVQKYLNYFYKLKCRIDNADPDTDFLAFRQYENDMFPETQGFYRIR